MTEPATPDDLQRIYQQLDAMNARLGRLEHLWADERKRIVVEARELERRSMVEWFLTFDLPPNVRVLVEGIG